MGVDQLLDLVVGDVVKGQAGVLGDVDLDAGLESGVLVESRFQVLDDHLVGLGEVGAEALVQVFEDRRECLDLLGLGAEDLLLQDTA